MTSLNSSLSVAGDSSHTTVLWKQGERVITAGAVKVRKDARLSMAEASSLKISGVGVADTGELAHLDCCGPFARSSIRICSSQPHPSGVIFAPVLWSHRRERE